MGMTALALALTAIVLSTICAAFVGVVLIEAQQFGDGTWAGMPRDSQIKASVLLAAQAVCGLMGLAAMAMGATAFLRRRGRGAGRMAMIVAALGPVVAWGPGASPRASQPEAPRLTGPPPELTLLCRTAPLDQAAPRHRSR